MAVPAPQRAPILDAGGIFKETWELFSRQWQTWMLLGLLYFLCLATCIGIFFIGPLTAGLYVAAFKQLRGQNPDVKDLFAGGPWFGSTTLVLILVGICCFFGFMLCIIPGLVLGIWWYFSLPLCISHNMSATDAMAASKAKVQEGFWDIVVFVLIIVAIQVVTGMLPYLGQILLGIPLQTIMIAVAHRDLFGLEGAVPPVGRTPAPAFQGIAPPQGAVACPKCNAPNVPGHRFCTACGGPIA
jgi:uncharacterized membrane protein